VIFLLNVDVFRHVHLQPINIPASKMTCCA